MAVTGTEIETAYRKLKSYVYYDKTDLRLRERLAKFECSDKFEARLKAVQEVADAKAPALDKRFTRWLTQIHYRVVPKKLRPARSAEVATDEAAGKFITNVTSAPAIEVETVNYFFDGPIELHLIAVLWLMREGRHLDARFLPGCRQSSTTTTTIRSSSLPSTTSSTRAGVTRAYAKPSSCW